jgi:hypothetical protein
MRCADLTPTPGRQRSAWISASSALVSDMQTSAGGNRKIRTETSCHRAGPGIPAVILPIFSCEVSSALRTAALKAAATRSSSMSLSSASRLGSMVTRLHLVLAGHGDLDQAGTRLAGDLDIAQFVLGLLHVVLHRLRLLHQASELSFVEHGIPWC